MLNKVDFSQAETMRLGAKGIAPTFWEQPVAKLAHSGIPALGGHFPTPLAVLKASSLENNLIKMAQFTAHNGLLLAPHGKTTLCLELFHRQIAAGAWGMTVASPSQASLSHAAGINRLIIANQVVDPCGLEIIADLQAGDPGLQLYFLVDSTEGAVLADQAFAKRGITANVLIEMGMPGGRCGCRSLAEVLDVARAIADLPNVNLCGIEGFEGLVFRSEPEPVQQFLFEMGRCFEALESEGLLAPIGPLLLTAGGSAYFDLATRLLRSVEHPRLIKVLRSGCYVSHDDGVYDEQLTRAVARDATCGIPDLRPALEVWATVLSRPEPGLAIINAGKRDLGCDVDYPFVRRHYRPSTMALPRSIAGAELFQMSDQHGFVRLPEEADVAVGDVFGLGVSHPCTTFDKWPVLLEVDDSYRVLGAIRSYF